MELLIASYVRGVSQVPETNRFIMNKQFYNRTELTVSFTLLMDTPDGSAEENAVKIRFDPSDTIFDVSARVKETIEKGRKADDPSFAIKLAKAVLKLPLVPNAVVGLVKLLDRYGLKRQRRYSPYMLSQGQQRRLAVLSVLAGGQELLLLDEPTYGQDARSVNAIMEHLREKVEQEGLTVIFITHDTELAAAWADKIYRLEDTMLVEKTAGEVL